MNAIKAALPTSERPNLRKQIASSIKVAVRATPLSTVLKEKLLFFGKMGYWPNFRNPRSFSEKVNWRKLYSSNPLYVKCSDKLAVREYVKEKIGEEFLIPVVFSGDSISPEQLLALGDDIVAKANHDSGSVCIVRENTPDQAEEFCAKLDQSLAYDYGLHTNQWWYSEIRRQIYVEKYLANEDGSAAWDFKFFVFKQPDGQPPKVLVSVIFGRGTPDHHRNFYDENQQMVSWGEQDIHLDYASNRHAPFPEIERYDEMYDAVLKLAEDFNHVRVDMYYANGQIYFGELTFTQGGGRSRWRPREFDFKLGEYWNQNREPGGEECP